ncbi:thioesterase II family protein [Aureimonas pseudogalii]|uniref:Surfactin synthase thioesterase subunit n=1 Tax=Aureimonas pseudogalii TaxID=1744844 RepID=A0A7W6E8M8_9HYPH|nr:alpha/beta fold hydrolase [Aureimonas pseudogalii]MBB3996743.1 surfactin synthase thioesterase subunit [Aureimonas pseudogalii]
MRPAALSLHRPLPGAALRIAAFPHAGGGASAFRGLAAALGARGVELCPLQAPGRENRIAAPFHRTAEAMAAEFAAALATLAPLPTVYLGHSLGGLVAYLTARLRTADGAPPHHLVASASLSPLLRCGRGAAAERPSPASFRERILALGGVPEAIAADPDLFALFEPAIRADFELADRYQHETAEPLPCPITVYSGLGDTAAPAAAAPSWQGLTRAPVRRRSFEGGHFFLYRQPDATAAALIEDLA